MHDFAFEALQWSFYAWAGIGTAVLLSAGYISSLCDCAYSTLQ